MSGKAPTLVLIPVKTLPVKVEFMLPPARPLIQGYLTAHCYIITRDELKEMLEDQMPDDVFFDKVVESIEGLASAENQGVALEGPAAMDEVKKGRFSQYLMPAVVGAYIESYGEARRKNSRTSQRR